MSAMVYRPGDKCIGQGFLSAKLMRYNGMSCVLLCAYLTGHPTTGAPGTHYAVRWDDGARAYVPERHVLRVREGLVSHTYREYAQLLETLGVGR